MKEAMKSTDLKGTIRMAGDADTGIRVEVHLDDETMSLVSPYGELGRWPLSGLGISARVDGFHIKVEGEELVLSTNDDARFALAVGIRSSSSPRLVRQLASARDDGFDVDERLAPRPPEFRQFNFPVETRPEPSRVPVAIAIMAAAGALFLAAVQAYGNPLRIFGAIPLWPLWFLGAVALGVGGFALFNQIGAGRRLVAGGASIGLLALIGSLSAMGSQDFSWLGDGVFLGGTGTVLALLLWGVDLLNRSE
ncbi:MAG: hypothetical protein ACR2NT_04210 [Acidimicrobiia bacterium]